LHRRALLAAGGALVGAAVTGGASAAAEPFYRRHALPIGIKLYTLGPDAAKDFEGTLKAVAGIGYRSVELAGFLGKSAADIKAALDQAGLACTSAHVQGRGQLDGDLAKLGADLRTIGVKYAVMPTAYIPERLGLRPAAGEDIGGYLRRVFGQMTADDWKMNADFLNHKAAALKSAGITVGYHNHNMEFAPVGGSTGLEILLANTDPALVTFELDVGWAAAAGVDPAAVFARHKGRFGLMHVKDIKADTQANFALTMDPTEVGSGRLDWKTLLPSAYAAGVRGFYVEQEPPFARPRIEAAKISHDFLAGVAA
jgi:sugar phosphate isomerase/epimerase